MKVILNERIKYKGKYIDPDPKNEVDIDKKIAMPLIEANVAKLPPAKIDGEPAAPAGGKGKEKGKVQGQVQDTDPEKTTADDPDKTGAGDPPPEP